jgi:Domain of unknown function (DUF4332)
MSYPIAKIRLIDVTLRNKLKAEGIRTTAKLLDRTQGLKERMELAKAIDIDDPRVLLNIANLADRMRIRGVGIDYAELLQVAGVDTVRELRQRNPANLASKMAEANVARKLVRVVPTQAVVTRWIEHAKKLELKITY